MAVGARWTAPASGVSVTSSSGSPVRAPQAAQRTDRAQGAHLLDVVATVPGADEGQFQEALEAAEGSCPVSNALRNNVDIVVNARLS